MRKRMYIFLLGLTLLGVTGCATESSNSNISPTFTPIVESEAKDNTGTPTPTIKNETNNSKKTPTPTKSSSAFLPNTKQEEPIIITKVDGLCEQLEQVDVSVQASYNSFNRMLSRDDELGLSGQSIFCIDESTGVVYFVNQGKDYYLYRLKDGEVKLAVAMPVKQVYTYQGLVYFMIESYEKYELEGLHNGDIYCYTPTTGTVELVYEAGAIEKSKEHRLTVNENGIYFSYFIETENKRNYYHYYLPFGESKPVEDTGMTTLKGWDNYVFNYTSNGTGIVLQNRSGNEEDNIELSNRGIRFCVKGDYLYSAERTYISCLNLKTGEETKYDFLEMWKSAVRNQSSLGDNSGVRVIESFTVTETDIWVTGFGTILGRLNLETKELSYSRICKDKNEALFYTIIELYTDGEQLYVTCGDFEGNRGRCDEAYFARIQTDTVENIAGYDFMVLEFLVE